MATPHISAQPGDFAPAVLMPGDPRRAERIAGQLMPDARKVSDVRGIVGYTGTHEGRPLSVMASGMGQPSLSIYATELYSFYGVERIVRVGTCGGLSPKVAVGDVVIAIGAHTDSAIVDSICPGVRISATASWNLLKAAADAVGEDPSVKIAPVVSRDRFYGNPAEQTERLAGIGTLGVEMEAAALYCIAAELDGQALAVLTVSDHLLDPSQNMSAADRETRFGKALALAVSAALS